MLLLVDAAVTLAWQEPLSALVASRGQDRLDDELAARFAEEREAPDRGGNRRIRAKRMAGSLRRGDALGRIVLPTLGRRYAIAEGTDSGTLRAAPGHYPATGLPGEGTTVAVAGHRTTYGAPFRTIDDLYRGDAVIVEMPYGRFTYRVSATRIVRPDETWVVRRVGRERLVRLRATRSTARVSGSSCSPSSSVGLRAPGRRAARARPAARRRARARPPAR
ncbi:MAG: sortase [Actinomycetota bacterium]|nr:sortase [Actinomycetota bacterium]